MLLRLPECITRCAGAHAVNAVLWLLGVVKQRGLKSLPVN
jgi:hypothetical protein